MQKEMTLKYADAFIDEAKMYLQETDNLPVEIFGLCEGIEPSPIITSSNKIGITLKGLARESEALILMFLGYTKNLKKGEVARDISNESDRLETLVCIVYLPEGMYTRRMYYKKHDTGLYTFLDLGWTMDRPHSIQGMDNPYLVSAK